MIREAIDHYGFVALATRVMFAELERLANMTLFALDDQAIFVGEGHDDSVSARGPLPRRSRAPPHPCRSPATPRLLLICGIWRGGFGGATRAPLVVQGRHGHPDTPPSSLAYWIPGTGGERRCTTRGTATCSAPPRRGGRGGARREGVEGPRRRRWRGLRHAAQDRPHLAPPPADQVCHNWRAPSHPRRSSSGAPHPRRLRHPRAPGRRTRHALLGLLRRWLGLHLLGPHDALLSLHNLRRHQPLCTHVLPYPPKTSARVQGAWNRWVGGCCSCSSLQCRSYNADDYPAADFNVVASGQVLCRSKSRRTTHRRRGFYPVMLV
ncbi:uncharacterized protein [Oryza sativa Japonica Group]|uniref:Expressed protein n=2 Tax=Oryza sativa subsp. japonica TaxID=39947 RepID=Q2QYP4_ORYSJ|nr:uncharacterized protein LOC4351294 [Oryza sativa Japonica Group]ABA96214.1 expressed protein [Oryza sativa Japonica Group]KAF2906285.1 hypothetical protein DAI22_12g008400 [Oryza sativa Japonica Group]BAT15561.1 Os12g0111000 [Oryza sativa Japonica Group]